MLKDFFDHANWLAIFVATLVYFVVGALWYSPILFAKIWVSLLPSPPSEEDKKRMPMLMVFTLIGNFAAVFAIAFFAWIMACGTVVPALKLGLFVSLCFCATVMGINMMYEKRPLKLMMINIGYHVVGICAAAVIVALWK
ncbi:MAG: Uncharacterized protein FD123_233 [Bacteroidetes bacterium]|nr:MAG: Uncharacterized protein FD123_233 [Bacteroidota bacterium]